MNFSRQDLKYAKMYRYNGSSIDEDMYTDYVKMVAGVVENSAKIVGLVIYLDNNNNNNNNKITPFTAYYRMYYTLLMCHIFKYALPVLFVINEDNNNNKNPPIIIGPMGIQFVKHTNNNNQMVVVSKNTFLSLIRNTKQLIAVHQFGLFKPFNGVPNHNPFINPHNQLVINNDNSKLREELLRVRKQALATHVHPLLNATTLTTDQLRVVFKTPNNEKPLVPGTVRQREWNCKLEDHQTHIRIVFDDIGGDEKTDVRFNCVNRVVILDLSDVTRNSAHTTRSVKPVDHFITSNQQAMLIETFTNAGCLFPIVVCGLTAAKATQLQPHIMNTNQEGTWEFMTGSIVAEAPGGIDAATQTYKNIQHNMKRWYIRYLDINRRIPIANNTLNQVEETITISSELTPLFTKKDNVVVVPNDIEESKAVYRYYINNPITEKIVPSFFPVGINYRNKITKHNNAKSTWEKVNGYEKEKKKNIEIINTNISNLNQAVEDQFPYNYRACIIYNINLSRVFSYKSVIQSNELNKDWNSLYCMTLFRNSTADYFTKSIKRSPVLTVI